ATLHVHLDESGDLRFDVNGSAYYVLSTAWTYDPGPLARELTALRFRLLKGGADIDSFHACEDQQANRDQVVAALAATNTWNFAAIVIEKRKVNPSIYEPRRFYPQFASMILRFVFRGRVRMNTAKVLVYTD